MSFVHVHSSGRHDRSVASLERAVDYYIEQGASIITLTEVNSKERTKTLAETGWDFVSAESAVLWDRTVWEILYEDSRPVTDMTGGKGKVDRKVTAAFAVLRHRVNGRRVVVGCTHLPASVTSPSGLSGSNVPLYLSAYRGTKRILKQLQRKYRADAIIFTGDFNLDIKKGWVRAWAKATSPQYRVTWEAPYPADGTHHNRIIDWTLIRGDLRLVVPARLLRDDVSSDHRPYAERLSFSR